MDWIEIPFPAEAEHDGLRLDRFLAVRLRGCSRAAAARLIEEGRARLEERPAKASRRLSPGETVYVRFPRRQDPPPLRERLEVLYEDERLLAVDKPAGILSHPTDKIKRNTVTAILAGQFPGARLYTVHRLDRETSGVFLAAKTRLAAAELSAAFAERRVAKEYWALVAGRAAFGWKIVDAPLGRAGGPIRVRQTAAAGGTPALTELEVLFAADDRSLVAARPKTGRLHQIRAHLAFLGHPVLGDKLYSGGGEAYLKAVKGELSEPDLAALGAPRQMLHARSLRLELPGGRLLELEAPLPDDFKSRLPAKCTRMKAASIEGGSHGRKVL